MKKPTPLTEKWKCVFHQPSVRGSVDPWISTEWPRAVGGKAPFGDLRNQFRKQHCRTLNPYGSEDCPYDQHACVSAFSRCVEATLKAMPKKPMAYFIKVARMDAAKRADEKPLTRDRDQRYSRVGTDVPPPETARAPRPGDTGNEDEGIRARQGLRSPAAGPTGIGELLGSLDFRPHQPSPDERKESAE